MRNLPESVTTEALAEVFVKFGALRGAQPVSIKRSKEKEKDTFAFVDFQEPAAQQAAIAGPATLDGQQVTPSCSWSLWHEILSKPVSLQASGTGPPSSSCIACRIPRMLATCCVPLNIWSHVKKHILSWLCLSYKPIPGHNERL